MKRRGDAQQTHTNGPDLHALEPRLLLSAGAPPAGTDLSALVDAWGQAGMDLPADLNGDGTVDVGDLGILAGRSAPATPGGDESAAETVVFADPVLEQMLRDQLGVFDRPLTPADLQGITAFGTRVSVWSIEGLQHCTNLRELSIHGPVSDLSPLSGLTSLQVLTVDRTWVKDLSPLAGLTNLQGLRLWDNPVTDVGPLAGLTQLAWLELTDNRIEDLSPLAELRNVETLWVQDNRLTSLAGIENMTRLTTLYAQRNRLADISAMSGLTSLTEAYLSDNAISDVLPLSGLNLEKLSLQMNDLSELPGDWSLPSLQRLWAQDNRLADVAGLSQLTSLQYVELDRNLIEHLPDLSALTVLRTIQIDDNRLVDLSPLAELPSLTQINAAGNPLTDLSPLGQTDLVRLDVARTGVAQLAPLAGLDTLYWLNITDCPVDDLSPLAGLTGLNTLLADRTQVADLSPLAGRPMKVLSANDARIAELPEGLAGFVQQLQLADNQITDLAPLLAGQGDGVDCHLLLSGNPLSAEALADQVPALRNRGVAVYIQPADADGEDDDPAAAQPLTPDVTQSGTLHSMSDVDWLTFTLDQPSSVRIHISAGDDWPDVRLYVRTGPGPEDLQRLDADLTRAVLSSYSHTPTLPAGEYLLRLEARSPYPLSPAPHENRTGSVAYQVELDLRPAQVQLVALGTFGQGEVLEEIDLLGIAPGQTLVQPVELVNRRAEPLAIDAVTLSGSGLQLVLPPGTPAGAVLQPDESIQALLRATGGQAGPITGELTLRSSDGDEWTWEVTGEVEPPVDVPDPTLRWWLGRLLDRPNGPLTPTTLASLDVLDMPQVYAGIPTTPIVSLEGLEHCTSLVTIDLPAESEISDLSPLSQLDSLTSLHLDAGRVTDLSPLTGLSRLTSLSLTYGRLTDVSPLADMQQLTYLSLAGNPRVDLTPLIDGPALEAGDVLVLGRGRSWEISPYPAELLFEQIPALQARGVEILPQLSLTPTHDFYWPYDAPVSALPLAIGEPVPLAMQPGCPFADGADRPEWADAGPERWYELKDWHRRSLVVQTAGLSGDTEIALFHESDLETPIAFDDDGGQDGFSRLERTGTDSLDEGTYYLRVTADGFVDGGILLSSATVLSDADANGDGQVDVGDLGILAANWQRSGDVHWTTGDFNDDGIVGAGDLGVLAREMTR